MTRNPRPPQRPSMPERARSRLLKRYGPWAVVTGASDGIGRAIAEGVAEAGINVVLVARRRQQLDRIAATLTACHAVETRAIAVDLAATGAVEAVIEAAQDLEIGLLAACAGFGTSGRLIDGDLDRDLNMVDVNCRAVLALTQPFAKRFAGRGRGGIVLMSSLLGFQGVARAANYAATKAYVQTLAEGLHRELRPFGVDVLAAAPGPVHTGFAAAAGMTMGLASQPQPVGRATLMALGRRATVRPGWLSKLLEASFFGMPRRIRSRILGQVMKGMARPPGETAGEQVRHG